MTANVSFHVSLATTVSSTLLVLIIPWDSSQIKLGHSSHWVMIRIVNVVFHESPLPVSFILSVMIASYGRSSI